MLLKVDTEKISKSIKDFDLEYLLLHMKQRAEIIEICNRNDMITDYINDLLAFMNCIEEIKE